LGLMTLIRTVALPRLIIAPYAEHRPAAVASAHSTDTSRRR
jgi:hypothetical protein